MYPCSGCGCCCKRIGVIVKLLGIQFPHAILDNGTCSQLTADNKCAVYETRPFICNIDAIAKALGIKKKRFYKQNIKTCNQMMDEDNIPQSFRIKI